jgi:phosphonate transport system substrate-binding protein
VFSVKIFRRPWDSRRINAVIILAGLFLLAGLLLSACNTDQQPNGRTPTPTLTLTPTFPPTLTPTPHPLGSTENPFVVGLVSPEEDPQIAAAAVELARQLSDQSGVAVTGRVLTSHAALLQAMGEGSIHITWLPPMTYVYASQRGLAEAALLTNHFGVYQYGAQFLANTERGFQPYFDPISGLNSADAMTALQQFDGLRPCWVEPLSVSGYIVPAGLMAANNYQTQTPVFIQSQTAVIRALYIRGICDFGATFAISGDPRTASAVQVDLPDVMNRILVIWRSDAVIPNLNISYLAGLSEGNRLTLNNAFLEIASSQDGLALLELSAGNYEIAELRAIDDSLYNPLRVLIQAANINPLEMIGR